MTTPGLFGTSTAVRIISFLLENIQFRKTGDSFFFFFSGVGGIFFCHFLGENSLGKKSTVFNDVRHCWPKRMMRQIAMYHTVNSTFA